MRRLIYLVLIIIVFLGCALVALPFLVSDESIKNTIISTFEEKTGRNLEIRGKTSLSAIPNLAIELGDVRLSNPKNMARGETISAQKMQVKLPLLPLLGGELQLQEFVLEKPVITLLKDKAGRVNWAYGDDEKKDDDGRGQGLGTLKDIKLGKIKIIDGRFSYEDQITGTSEKLLKVNTDIVMSSLSSPLSITGDLAWRAEKISLSLNLENPKKLLSGDTAALKIDASSKHFKTVLGGTIATKTGPVFSGNFSASSPALKSFIVWMGKPAPTIGGLGPFRLNSNLSYADQIINLSGLKLGLDKISGAGNAKLNLAGERPRLTGKINFDVLNLAPYLSSPSAGSGKSAKRASGWSREKIDFSALKAADADLSLRAKKLIARDIKIENTALSVKLENGIMRALLPQFTLYGGKGKGAITVNARGGSAALASNMQLSGMNARGFLRDATGFGKVEGAAAFNYTVSSKGSSQYDIMKNMQGRGGFNFADGAIRGINIAQMVRSLGSNILSGWSASEAQKTDFSTFSGTYTITNGRVTNPDLKLLGPLVRLTGAGTINLPGRSLHYKVSPRLVGSLKGQGGIVDLAGVDVPIIIKGPWAKPQIYPDIAGILQNPEAAYRNLKNIGKTLDPKKGADALNELLKGKDQNGQQQDPLKAIEKNLKGLF